MRKFKLGALVLGAALVFGAAGCSAFGESRAVEVGAGIEKTVSWTATASNNLGAIISAVDGTDSGSVNMTGSETIALSYTRTLIALADGKKDNISFQGNTWIQLGSNNAMETLTFTTSGISGTIKSVSVVTATAGTHQLTIDVGGTKYLDAASLTVYSGTAGATNPDPANCVKTGTGTSSGTLTISLAPSGSTKKAVLIRSVSVTYEPEDTGEPVIALDKTEIEMLSNASATSVTVTPNDVFTATPTISVDGTPSYVNVSVNGLTVSVSPKAVGSETLTIRATHNSEVATATLSVKVKDKHGRVADDPFTVAEARAQIDAGTFTDDLYYTSGIVSEIVTAYSSQYKNISFNISADGTTTSNQFQAYRCVTSEQHPITGDSDIQVGATLTIAGKIKKYSSTYEADAGCYVVSYTAPATSKELTSIALSGTYPIAFNTGDAFSHSGMVVTAYFDDSSDADVSNSATFTGYDMNTASVQTVTVSYSYGEVTKTAQYTITVSEVIPPTPGETKTYKKVASELSDYSGDYLIVYEGDDTHDAVAFDGSLATLDAVENGVAVTIENDEIVISEDYEFHIEKENDTYTVQSASGFYIGQTSDGNGLTQNNTTTYAHSISYDDIASSAGPHLRYNNASNQLRFRYYKSSSYTGQKEIALYKEVEEDALAVWSENYMFMNDPAFDGDGTGQCKSSNYYKDAKTALLALEEATEGTIARLQSEDEFADTEARYLAWAKACGDNAPFVDDFTFLNARADMSTNNSVATSGTNMIAIIVILSVALVSSTGAVTAIIIKKRTSR